MSELALNHEERDTLARHLDRVRMPELMGRESPAHTGGLGGAA